MHVIPRTRRCLALIVVSIAATVTSTAQTVDTIRMNPRAVLLKRIWAHRGPMAHDEVGRTVAVLGDYDGDGYSDFAYSSAENDEDTRRVFRGGPDGPVEDLRYRNHRTFGFTGNVVGDFWGTGHKAIGARQDTMIPGFTNLFARLAILRTEANSIDTLPAGRWMPGASDSSIYVPHAFHVADLDRDGFDELIVLSQSQRTTSTIPWRVELIVYAGGTDFQVSSPTVIIRDNETTNGASSYSFAMQDIDSDGYRDIVMTNQYHERPPRTLGYEVKLKVWFGGPDLARFDRAPDRIARIPGKRTDMVVGDFNGDGSADIATCHAYEGSSMGIRLHLSGHGKDQRTRSFDSSDVDRIYLLPSARPVELGPLADSSGRYHSLGVVGLHFDRMLLVLTGGPDGPDAAFDAFYSTWRDGMHDDDAIRYGGPAGDINGDGWRDVLFGWPGWTELRYGVVVALGGGDYIPADMVTAAPEPMHRAQDLLRAYPNPFTTSLRIALDGEAAADAATVDLYDATGRRVRHAAVADGRAVLDAGALVSGAYLLVARGAGGEIVAAQAVVKQ